MNFIDFFKKENLHINIEVFKGKLEKDAVIDSVKKEFSENSESKEAVFIAKEAPEEVLTKILEILKVNLIVSNEFETSFLTFVSNKNKITKIIVIITEGLEESFVERIKENKFILRIAK